MSEICALCGVEAPLQISHIIPGFAIDRLRETSVGLRSAQTPNRRVQDGVKVSLLCAACETHLSKWEKLFFERIYVPLNENDSEYPRLPYEDWALKFTVSVSWRVLTFYDRQGLLSSFTEEQTQAVSIALEVWREFILGKLPHPAEFEQHLYPFDYLMGHSQAVSPYINRYVLRTIDMDVVVSPKSFFVYTKLSRVILVGFLRQPNLRFWRGGKIHVRKGIVGSAGYGVPTEFLEYINDKANHAGEAFSNLSPKQSLSVEQRIIQKGDVFMESETFRAMSQDEKLSRVAPIE